MTIPSSLTDSLCSFCASCNGYSCSSCVLCEGYSLFYGRQLWYMLINNWEKVVLKLLELYLKLKLQ